MELHNHLLSKEARSKLDDIAALIIEDKVMRRLIRMGLEVFFGRFEIDLRPYELTRLYKKPSSVRYEHMVYYHDFITSRNARDLIKQSGDEKHCKKVLKQIDLLTSKSKEANGKSLNILSQISEAMDMENYVEKISKSYCDEYIGYRRSANKNDIVRFTLDITETDNDRLVEYENDYIRPDLHWNALGFGVSVKETLYLIGHARSAVPTNAESLGLRFMALRKYGTEGTLLGLLISMDTNQKIIAARIVLIPRDKHSFGEDYAGLDEDAFVSKIIEGTLLDPDVLREEILSQVGSIIKGKDRNHLFRLIRNHAFSGLKLIPSEFDDEIASLEDRIEEFAMQSGTPPREIYMAALKRHIEEVIDLVPPH